MSPKIGKFRVQQLPKEASGSQRWHFIAYLLETNPSSLANSKVETSEEVEPKINFAFQHHNMVPSNNPILRSY